ncbi:MAG: hypothetical protein K2Q21_06000 [Chitinophagaceae bacterium]|nr:hypothetical protein [Chitinophagaceae bacterium]
MDTLTPDFSLGMTGSVWILGFSPHAFLIPVLVYSFSHISNSCNFSFTTSVKRFCVLQSGLFASVSVENFWCIIKIGYIVSVRNKNIKLHKK